MAVDMIRTDKMGWTYGSSAVLDAISARFPAESLNCVVGPNGSGKTTFLKCLLGLLDVPAGKVFYRDRDLKSFARKELARTVAYVPQNSVQQFDFTVREVVESGRYPHLGRLKGMQAHDNDIVSEAIRQAEVSAFAGKSVTSLSGGEAQRVSLARALAQESSVILLDEPTAHLDIHHQINIFRLLRKLVETRGLTVIAVIHNLDFVLAYADYAVVLHEKKVYASGAPGDIISPDTCKTVFGIEADITKNTNSGKPLIIPRF